MAHRHWNVVTHTEDNEDDLPEDLENIDFSFAQAASNNVSWTDDEEVNVDAAHNNTFLQEWACNDSDPSQHDIFYDCDPSKFLSEEEQHTHSLVRECCTIFDISSVTAPSRPRSAGTSTNRGVIRNSGKPWLHIPIHVGNHKT